jgi:hypothetical protein
MNKRNFGAMKNNRTIAVTSVSLCLFYAMSIVGGAQTLTRDRFPTGTYQEGDFNATFTKDGEVMVFSDDLVKARGLYRLEGNTIIIKDKEQGECSGEGKYRWKFDGKALTFTKISDACSGRTHHLTSRAWQLLKRDK